VDTLRDHWTVVTRDGLPSVHVEHTFAVTRGGIMVVTADEDPPAAPAAPAAPATPATVNAV
jgi:methionyl aminopeptidase